METEINAGYEITERIKVGESEFVLGELKKDFQQFVTWKCSAGEKDYYWGHYFDDRLTALEDLCNRTLEEVQAIKEISPKYIASVRPLNPDELPKRIGKPVWIQNVDGQHGRWEIYDGDAFFYGKHWVAYKNEHEGFMAANHLRLKEINKKRDLADSTVEQPDKPTSGLETAYKQLQGERDIKLGREEKEQQGRF